MSNTDPEFITCAMDALEEGIKPQEIMEECALPTWEAIA